MSGAARVLVGTALLLALAPAAAAAGDAAAQSEGWGYEMWEELMSPFCPGRSLADCPSGQAETLRSWILVQEAAGRSRTEVEAELLERFGDALLAAPRPRGFGLAAYLVPAAAFLAGGCLVALYLRRHTAAPGQRADVPVGELLDPELERAIDEEMGRS